MPYISAIERMGEARGKVDEAVRLAASIDSYDRSQSAISRSISTTIRCCR
jgi:hypothetical protein